MKNYATTIFFASLAIAVSACGNADDDAVPGSVSEIDARPLACSEAPFAAVATWYHEYDEQGREIGAGPIAEVESERVVIGSAVKNGRSFLFTQRPSDVNLDAESNAVEICSGAVVELVDPSRAGDGAPTKHTNDTAQPLPTGPITVIKWNLNQRIAPNGVKGACPRHPAKLADSKNGLTVVQLNDPNGFERNANGKPTGRQHVLKLANHSLAPAAVRGAAGSQAKAIQVDNGLAWCR